MLFAAVILLSSGLVVYAATTLFTQTFPGQTFSSPPGFLTAGSCGNNLLLDQNYSTIPKYSGLSANLVFDCTVNATSPTRPAFTTGSSASTVTPTFTEPTGWNLAIDNNPNCVIPIFLASATPMKLLSSSSYYYCLIGSSGNFSSFSITWSQ